MRCLECNEITTDYYMVRDELWLQAVPQENGCGECFLCIKCLEKRLGRKLVREDFTDCPVNAEIRMEK